ncbi:MAG TPA: lysine--tRNA ligase [Firmicutes bacterium]|nr:lysine--tRNA ligase [Bacillota bacterium]
MAEDEKMLDQVVARRAKLAKYREMGINPYGQRFEVDSHVEDLKKEYSYLKPEEITDKKVHLAGRIVLIRRMGKASFFTLQDRTGRIQGYLRKDVCGDDNYALFKLADLGDICGIEGVMMKTKTGELTVRVSKYTHLSKALRPLPDKFHGLTDKEERYRHRYVDLIVNDDAMRIAKMRSLIVKELRDFFFERGFLEVETPILSPILGGANARPFITHHNSLDEDFYLRIATELPLKRLLVGGMERVFECGRIFRNEGIDLFHNPEFTTVEAYQAYADLSDMMELQETLIKRLAKNISGSLHLKFNGYDIDLEKPFRQVNMTDMVKEKTGVDFVNVKTDEEAIELAKKFNVPLQKHFRYGHIINAFFDQFCESELVQPTFVCRHPLDVSPLAFKCPDDPRFTQRFELYIGGHEISNAFTELNDPDDQLARFEEQIAEKKAGNDEACEVDYDYVEALQYGLPPTGGIGIGIDRLVMLLTQTDSIREVLLFPTLKRQKINPNQVVAVSDEADRKPEQAKK